MKPEPGLQPPSMAFAFSATSRHDRKLQSKSPSPDVGARRRLSPKSKTPAQDFMSIETNHAPPRQDFLSRRGPISCKTSWWSWGESNPRESVMAGVGLCEFVQCWSGNQSIGTPRRDAK